MKNDGERLANMASGAAAFGAAVADRGSTAMVYTWDTGRRRAGNPIQTAIDVATGTVAMEDAVAYGEIFISDAELLREGPYCGSERLFG